MDRDGSCIQMGQIFVVNLPMTSLSKTKTPNPRNDGGLLILMWDRQHHRLIQARDRQRYLSQHQLRAQQQKAAG